MTETVNSYIKALASRKEYSGKAVDLFIDRFEKGKIITLESVQWALKACATAAYLQSAVEIIKIMKSKAIEPDSIVYSEMLKVYASVCDKPNLEENQRELLQMDSWKILQEAQNKNLVNVHLLNSLMSVYAQGLRE